MAGRDRAPVVTVVTPDQVVVLKSSLTCTAGCRRAGAGRGHPRAPLAAARLARAPPPLLEDVWTGEQRRIGCAVLIDCGHRLAQTRLHEAALASSGPQGVPRAGDCVAPRTAAEAVLEGRRCGLEIGVLEREEPPPATRAQQRQPAAR